MTQLLIKHVCAHRSVLLESPEVTLKAQRHKLSGNSADSEEVLQGNLSFSEG